MFDSGANYVKSLCELAAAKKSGANAVADDLSIRGDQLFDLVGGYRSGI
jgi:hypothetical protein